MYNRSNRFNRSNTLNRFNRLKFRDGPINKKPESGNPETMKKTETLAETGGFLNLLVGCISLFPRNGLKSEFTG